MPFEPLQTDEKIEGGSPKRPDFDAQLMAGCGQFIIQSVSFYFLGAWAFFAFPDVFALRALGIDLALGLIPSLTVSVLAARKFGLASAAGSLAGSMVLGVFLFLRLKQVHVPSILNSLPQPEWPSHWIWMIPTCVLVITALMLGIVMKNSEWDPPQRS